VKEEDNMNLKKILGLLIRHCYLISSKPDSCLLSELALDFCAFPRAVLLHSSCVYRILPLCKNIYKELFDKICSIFIRENHPSIIMVTDTA